MKLLVVLLLVFALHSPPSVLAAECGPQMADFRPIVRAMGPEKVGFCTGEGRVLSERTMFQRGDYGVVWLEAGDLVQETEHGILTMIPSDTVIAFYAFDGYSWQWSDDEGLTRMWANNTAPEPFPPDPVPTPRTSSARGVEASNAGTQSQLTSALVGRCATLAADTGGLPVSRLCEGYGERHGVIGVTCFEIAVRESQRTMGLEGSGSGRLVVDAMQASTELCIASAERAGR